MKIFSQINYLFLEHPRKYLGSFYFYYLQIILFVLGIITKNRLRITQDSKSGVVTVFQLDGSIKVQAPYRVLRIRHGLSTAGENLWIHHYQAATEFKLTELDLLIDVGANIGELSRYFLDKGKNVIAFEPDPACLECLTYNLRNEATIIGQALSDHVENRRLYLSTQNADTSLINPSHKSLNIVTTTLKAQLSRYPRETLMRAILKMDVEGWEPEVLRGAEEKLNEIGYLVIDAGAERLGQFTYEQCTQILEENGFKVKMHKKVGVLYATNKNIGNFEKVL